MVAITNTHILVTTETSKIYSFQQNPYFGYLHKNANVSTRISSPMLYHYILKYTNILLPKEGRIVGIQHNGIVLLIFAGMFFEIGKITGKRRDTFSRSLFRIRCGYRCHDVEQLQLHVVDS